MSELLKINVNEHTEKKNGLTYLSWAWAWAEVLKIDPSAEWEPRYFGPETNQVPWCALPDGSMMVGIRLVIKGSWKQCLLPVMDHRNKAIKNPDAFAVNTALMRCLAKCIAMHGLGLYIYAGEDLPEQEEAPKVRVNNNAPESFKPTDGALEKLPPDEREYIQELAETIKAYASDKDMAGAVERLSEENLEVDQKIALWSLLPANIRSAIKHISVMKETA